MSDPWTDIGRGGADFAPTRLTLLARALVTDPAVRGEALDALLGGYWKPLYAFVRAQGRTNEEAKDLVQGFCAHVLEKGFLAKYVPSRGRFRFFLLGHLRGYLRDQADLAHAKRRGGGRKALPLDEAAATPARQASPEEEFDREWARGLVERAFERWKARLRAEDKGAWVPIVEMLAHDGFGGLPPVTALAEAFGFTESQVRHFVHRGKEALREEMLCEIRQGVGSDAEAEEELRLLQELFARTV